MPDIAHVYNYVYDRLSSQSTVTMRLSFVPSESNTNSDSLLMPTAAMPAGYTGMPLTVIGMFWTLVRSWPFLQGQVPVLPYQPG